jgi:hypothetical protein
MNGAIRLRGSEVLRYVIEGNLVVAVFDDLVIRDITCEEISEYSVFGYGGAFVFVDDCVYGGAG